MSIFAPVFNPISNYSCVFCKSSFTKYAVALINYNPVVIYFLFLYKVREPNALAYVNFIILMPQLLCGCCAAFNDKHGLEVMEFLIQLVLDLLHNCRGFPDACAAVQY